MRVQDVMTADVVTTRPNASLKEVAAASTPRLRAAAGAMREKADREAAG